VKIIIILLFIAYACIINLQAQDFDITTIAGIGAAGYSGDGGQAINCSFYYPQGLHLDDRGNLYIADLANSRIRKITLSTGIITTVAGNDTFGYTGDGGAATNAALWYPEDVFTDSAENIFFADGLDNCVRKVTAATGIITTVAGNGTIGSSGDGGTATNATLNAPCSLCLDKFGNIYIAEAYGNRIRKVEAATGIITTIAGTGVAGSAGIGGPATNAELNGPVGVFLDSIGDIFISDADNNTLHKIDVYTNIISTRVSLE
jgi:hypothetical protein